MPIFSNGQEFHETADLIQQSRNADLGGKFLRVLGIGFDLCAAVAQIGSVTVALPNIAPDHLAAGQTPELLLDLSLPEAKLCVAFSFISADNTFRIYW